MKYACLIVNTSIPIILHHISKWNFFSTAKHNSDLLACNMWACFGYKTFHFSQDHIILFFFSLAFLNRTTGEKSTLWNTHEVYNVTCMFSWIFSLFLLFFESTVFMLTLIRVRWNIAQVALGLTLDHIKLHQEKQIDFV